MGGSGHVVIRWCRDAPGRGRRSRPVVGQPVVVGPRRHPHRTRRPQPRRQRGVGGAAVQRRVRPVAGGAHVPRPVLPNPRRRRLGPAPRRRRRRAGRARDGPGGRRLLHQPRAHARGARPGGAPLGPRGVVGRWPRLLRHHLRGGTHCEWSWIPVVCAATGYGLAIADHFTTAWFDRYLHPSPSRQAAGGDALLLGPVPDGATGGIDELAHRANFLSVRLLSAYRCRCAPGGETVVVSDIRAAAGLSPVGDWAGANADRPAVRPD